MRLEIVNTGAATGGIRFYTPGYSSLAVNGRVIPPEAAIVTGYDVKAGEVTVRVTDQQLSDQLLDSSPLTLPASIVRLTLQRPSEAGYAQRFLDFDRTAHTSRTGPTLSFIFAFDLPNFKQLWSPSEYDTAVERLLSEAPIPGLRRIATQPGLDFAWAIQLVAEMNEADADAPFSDAVERWEPRVDSLHQRARFELAQSIRADAVVAHFRFPPAVKVACEQYLIFFLQFLAEVGIHADVDLQHQAGQVLFSVIPQDGQRDQALHQIRRALEVYLELPSRIPFGVVPLGGVDVPTQQLIANVQHLNGQIALAGAIIQAKDATIAAQQAQLDGQRQPLTGEVLGESLRALTVRSGGKEETESLFGGLVRLTTYKGKGVDIDLPGMYRAVRKWITGEEGSSPP